MQLVNSIKEAFKGKNIEISVTESLDDTAYLLASENNRMHLLQSVKDLEKGKGITMTVEELHKKYNA